MICLELNRFVYDPWMLHLSEFVWILRSSVLVVFNNYLLIDATDRSKIRIDQKRFFIALSLYPFNFSRTLPLTMYIVQCTLYAHIHIIQILLNKDYMVGLWPIVYLGWDNFALFDKNVWTLPERLFNFLALWKKIFFLLIFFLKIYVFIE